MARRSPMGLRPSARRHQRSTSIAPRAYIGRLEAEGVIQRQADGFPLDQSRVAYIRYLRRERRLSPRAEADVEHVRVKTEMLQLRLMEKKRELLRREDFDEAIDSIAGVVVTHLRGMAGGAPTIWRRGARSTPWCMRSAKR
jgi:hypothetical protein